MYYTQRMITVSDLQRIMTYDPTAGGFLWAVQRGRMKPGDKVGSCDREGYRRVRIDGRQYYEHRLVWFWHHGVMPRILDHINRNRADNRIENLRECHESQNAANAKAPSTNTSGYRGVYFDVSRGKWAARIRVTIDGVRHRYRIGRYNTAEEAALHYNMHLMRHYPDFALLNKVDTPLGKILGMA